MEQRLEPEMVLLPRWRILSPGAQVCFDEAPGPQIWVDEAEAEDGRNDEDLLTGNEDWFGGIRLRMLRSIYEGPC